MALPIMHIIKKDYFNFEGWMFEYTKQTRLTPWPVNMDFKLKMVAGTKFFEMIDRFMALSESEQELLRVKQ